MRPNILVTLAHLSDLTPKPLITSCCLTSDTGCLWKDDDPLQSWCPTELLSFVAGQSCPTAYFRPTTRKPPEEHEGLMPQASECLAFAEHVLCRIGHGCSDCVGAWFTLAFVTPMVAGQCQQVSSGCCCLLLDL